MLHEFHGTLPPDAPHTSFKTSTDTTLWAEDAASVQEDENFPVISDDQ